MQWVERLYLSRFIQVQYTLSPVLPGFQQPAAHDAPWEILKIGIPIWTPVYIHAPESIPKADQVGKHIDMNCILEQGDGATEEYISIGLESQHFSFLHLCSSPMTIQKGTSHFHENPLWYTPAWHMSVYNLTQPCLLDDHVTNVF